MTETGSGRLTGRKVLVISLICFAVILTPNIILMVKALDTFSGLVVPNSYIASQSFDRNREAQEALGWNVAISHENNQFNLAITNATGDIVRPQSVQVTIGRPTTEQQDIHLTLAETPAGYAAPAELEPGSWRIELAAVAGDGTPFNQRHSIFVRKNQ